MPNIPTLRLLALSAALLLAGCVHPPHASQPTASRAMTGVGYVGPGSEPQQVEMATVDPDAGYRPITIRVTGYGAAPYSNELTPTQRKLLSMRSSKLDAYRAIAEQVQ